MTLDLDARQRAMLQEMGVRVFAPLRPEPEVAAAALNLAPPAPPAPSAPAIAARTAPVVHPVKHARLDAGSSQAPNAIAGMDWDALSHACVERATCEACPGQGAPLFGAGDSRPEWLIIGDPPDEADLRSGEPFAGDAGVLLDNMLKAVGLDRRHKVYLTSIMKCRLPGGRNPTRDEVAQCEPLLRRQVELLRPRIIVVMGRFAVGALLNTAEPVGKLRGRVHENMGVPVVVTYPPAYLLRNLTDKGKAWADLCLAHQTARATVGGGQGAAGASLNTGS